MPPAASRMFTTRVPQASRVFLRPPGGHLTAVSPDVELKTSAVRAQPETDAVPPSIDDKTVNADIATPAPEQPETDVAASSDAASEAVSEASVEAPAEPDTPAEAGSASETPSSETAAPAAAAAPAEEARSEPPAADKPPPEYISLEDFPHSVGDVVTGRVLFSNARGARVAIHGVKGVLGYLPKNRGPFHLRNGKQANTYSDGMAQVIPQGTTRRFKILALPPDMAKGGKGPLLVCDDVDLGIIWKRLNNVKDLNNTMRETILCTVTGAVERGLLVNLFGVRGFVPVSHVTKQEGQEWLAKEDLQKFIGQEIEVSLMVLDQQKRTFTASMNNAVSDKALRQLRIGSLVWGTARRLTNYGVFMSLDNTFESALLHITNVSWNRVPTIESVFNEGDRIRAVVIGMDEGFSRISVSTRDLEETEGEMLTDPQRVYDNAENGVKRFLEHVKKWEAEQAAEGGQGAEQP